MNRGSHNYHDKVFINACVTRKSHEDRYLSVHLKMGSERFSVFLQSCSISEPRCTLFNVSFQKCFRVKQLLFSKGMWRHHCGAPNSAHYFGHRIGSGIVSCSWHLQIMSIVVSSSRVGVKAIKVHSILEGIVSFKLSLRFSQLRFLNLKRRRKSCLLFPNRHVSFHNYEFSSHIHTHT